MVNTLDYIIRLKDLMSASLKRIEAASAKTFSAAGSAMSKLEKTQAAASKTIEATTLKASRRTVHSIETIERALRMIEKRRDISIDTSEIQKANQQIKTLEGRLARLKNGLGNGLNGKIGQWRKDFISSMPGSQFIRNPLTMAGGAIAGIWSATQKAMQAGMEKMQLVVLTGQKAGNQLFKGLTKFATDTVFGSEVYSQATQMLANGIQASEILPDMKMLGDLSMGNSDKLGQLSLAFAQVRGKGHLAGQELLQMINAGFNPLQVISQKTGQSMSDLMKKMEKSKISFDNVKKAMGMATGPGGKFNKMLDRIASTPAGQLENLKGSLEQMMIKIGNVFLPIASKFMQFISWISEKMGPALEPVIAIIGGLSVGILAVAAAQWVWNAAQLANPVTWIIAGIVALIALIGYLIYKIDGWGDAWHHTVQGAKLLWQAFTFSAKNAWNTMVNLIMIGLDKIKLGWYKFKNAVGLGDKNKNSAMISQINSDVEKRKNEIIAGAKKSIELQAKAGQEFLAGIHSLKWDKNKTLSGFTGQIKQSLGMPGATAGVSTGSATGTTTGSTATQTNNAIATGGTKSTTVNIHIGNLVRDFKITAQNLNEAKEKIRDQIVDEITRAVAMGAALGA